MPDYGVKTYWDSRYERTDEPFDWVVDYASLAPTLEPLLPDKSAAILVVGCGDAPFSADFHYKGGYLNALHVDYSEVVIEKQQKALPEIKFAAMDCLNMKEVDDNSIGKLSQSNIYVHYLFEFYVYSQTIPTADVVIDKSLIDTTMCYTEGYKTTMRLYSELHRVLRPGGRLVTISFHSEEKVMPFGTSTKFIASSCVLGQADAYRYFYIFDKIEGLEVGEAQRLASTHPIKFMNASDRNHNLTSYASDKDDDSVDPYFGFGSKEGLHYAFTDALDEVLNDLYDGPAK